jgi:alkyl hydroperoxide reductase subunit AhpC
VSSSHSTDMAGLQKPREILRIGSVAPDFEADSTEGRIRFYDYIGDHWALLFFIPDDFTPVATTELVIFAHLQSEFAERNVKFVVVSTQNRPSSDGGYVPHSEWLKDINEIYPNPDPHAVRFPLVTDKDGELSYKYDILDLKDVRNLNADDEVTTGKAFKSRTLFIIGPSWESKHHIRMAFNYPAAVGFNIPEIFRGLGALQVSDSAHVRTPANWVPGGDVVVPPWMPDSEATQRFGNIKPVINPYLSFTKLELPSLTFTDLSFREGALVANEIQVGNGKMKVKGDNEKFDVPTAE